MIIKAEITKRVNGDKPLKAFADVIIDGAVVIHGIGVVEKEAGRYITMPRSQWKNKEGEPFPCELLKTILSSSPHCPRRE